jgi:hypothetical protein
MSSKRTHPPHPSTPSSHLPHSSRSASGHVTPGATSIVPVSANEKTGNQSAGNQSANKRYKKTTGGYGGPVRGDRPLEKSLIHKSTSPIQATLTRFINGGTVFEHEDITHTHPSSSPCFTRSIGADTGGDDIMGYVGGNLGVAYKGEHWDPRGFQEGTDGEKMPAHYCTSCRCPPQFCHERIFGEFIELAIIYNLSDIDTDPSQELLDGMFKYRYNEELQRKIFEVTKTYDTSTYQVPYCVRSQTYKRLTNYVDVSDYHFEMHKKITIGRDVPRDAWGTRFGYPTR